MPELGQSGSRDFLGTGNPPGSGENSGLRAFGHFRAFEPSNVGGFHPWEVPCDVSVSIPPPCFEPVDHKMITFADLINEVQADRWKLTRLLANLKDEAKAKEKQMVHEREMEAAAKEKLRLENGSST